MYLYLCEDFPSVFIFTIRVNCKAEDIGIDIVNVGGAFAHILERGG